MDHSGVELDNLMLTDEELLRIYDNAIEGGGTLIVNQYVWCGGYSYMTVDDSCHVDLYHDSSGNVIGCTVYGCDYNIK